MSGKYLIFMSLLLFSLGYVIAAGIYSGQFASLMQNPSDIAKEQFSPFNRISQDNIHVYSDRVTIDIDNPIWASFADTNSMDPLLDEGSYGIEIRPNSENEINVGDVAAYKSSNGDIIIHRVVEIDEDDEGVYFVFKGDNVPYVDPEQVRFEQIEGILVAVIY